MTKIPGKRFSFTLVPCESRQTRGNEQRGQPSEQAAHSAPQGFADGAGTDLTCFPRQPPRQRIALCRRQRPPIERMIVFWAVGHDPILRATTVFRSAPNTSLRLPKHLIK